MLTGVSTEYYARLERGNLRGVSEAVLESLAGALQLDEAEGPTCLTWQRPPHPRTKPGRGGPVRKYDPASNGSWTA